MANLFSDERKCFVFLRCCAVKGVEMSCKFLNVTDSAYDGSVYAEAWPIQSHFPKIPTEQFCVSAVVTKYVM